MQRSQIPFEKEEGELVNLESPSEEQGNNEQTQASLGFLNRIANAFRAIDMGDIFGIFLMHLKPKWKEILDQIAKYPMFAAAAVFALIGAGFSIQRARLDGNNANIQGAIISSISAFLIAGAVGMALLGPEFGFAELAELAPVIFASVLSFGAVLNGVNALTNLIQANRTSDPRENRSLHEQARGNGLNMLVGLAIAVAVIGVMIMKINDVAWVGVGGAAIGVADAVRRTAQGSTKKKGGYTQLATEDFDSIPLEPTSIQHQRPELNTSAALIQTMNNVASEKGTGKDLENKTSKSPYQEIPKIPESDRKNVIPFPSTNAQQMSLGGTVKSVAEMQNQLKRTGTDSTTRAEEMKRSPSFGYSGSSDSE